MITKWNGFAMECQMPIYSKPMKTSGQRIGVSRGAAKSPVMKPKKMKKSSVLILLLMMMATQSALAQQGENLVQNGTFEQGYSRLSFLHNITSNVSNSEDSANFFSTTLLRLYVAKNTFLMSNKWEIITLLSCHRRFIL